MKTEPNITVFYEKFYIDSVSRHIPSLLESNSIENITIKQYWSKSVDAFYSFPCTVYLTCISGDLRVVTPYNPESDNMTPSTWKFNQYFISELDGKVIKLAKDTIFGINNMNQNKSILFQGLSKKQILPKRIDNDIFNWNK